MGYRVKAFYLGGDGGFYPADIVVDKVFLNNIEVFQYHVVEQGVEKRGQAYGGDADNEQNF